MSFDKIWQKLLLYKTSDRSQTSSTNVVCVKFSLWNKTREVWQIPLNVLHHSSPNSTQTTHPTSSVHIQIKPKSRNEFVPPGTEKSGFLDLGGFGVVANSVETVINSPHKSPRKLVFTSVLSGLTNRALLWKYRALLWKYRALLWKYRALLWKCRALLWKYRALLRKYSAF